jgi:Holliday junction resolvase
MTTQPDYLRYLAAAKQAQIADELRAQGFAVDTQYAAGDVVFDLVARKGTRRVAYEFKAGKSERTSREGLEHLQRAASREGLEFRIVVVIPPSRLQVEVKELANELLMELNNTLTGVHTLPVPAKIDRVSDIGYSEIHIGEGRIHLAGTAAADVTFTQSNTQEGVSLTGESFPFTFNVTTDAEGKIIQVNQPFEFDLSSFVE